MKTTIIGFPRIGINRELKKWIESFWENEITEEVLKERCCKLRKENLLFLKEEGLDLIPVGDFSLYDRMLDTCCMVGAVPDRFESDNKSISLNTYFAMARGGELKRGSFKPLEMTKWFNTNYHYLVPEFKQGQKFSFCDRTILSLFDEAKESGISAMPVLIGPVSFLLLGKMKDKSSTLSLIDSLLEVYSEVISFLSQRGADWIMLEEPCFVMERSKEEIEVLRVAYKKLSLTKGKSKLGIITYFDTVGENYEILCELPVDGIGLDLVDGVENIKLIEENSFPEDKFLFAGVVNGRNIWVNNFSSTISLLSHLRNYVPYDRLTLSSSCSLLHVPMSLEEEVGFSSEIKKWMAFAKEKVREIVFLKYALTSEKSPDMIHKIENNKEAIQSQYSSQLKNIKDVRERIRNLKEEDFGRKSKFLSRRNLQRKILKISEFPTTTIGSFPQTDDLRKVRNKFKKGVISLEDYNKFLRDKIGSVIKIQEEIGLDVLVHGEFERSDMVEYFAEQLKGFIFSQNGWILSYGTRCVKPPIIFGDIQRVGSLTVDWISYAQSLTEKPVKGMLTGPVTLLQWSFVREDIPRKEVCYQLALALRDEVSDLEKAGIKVIQIDEPALREGMPLRVEKQAEYLDWAVNGFRLASGGAEDSTQIHTHMCYSNFNEIIDSISKMDADVLLIENARSENELLDVFKQTDYPNDIGPGVYDIHSPLIPSQEEIVNQLIGVTKILNREKIWVNPDCGLKTRKWEEVIPSLKNMVSAAKKLRQEMSIE